MSPDDTRASRDDADDPPPCYPCFRMSSRLTWVLLAPFAVGCGASRQASPVPATTPAATPPNALEVTKEPRRSVTVTGVSRPPVTAVVQPPPTHPDWKQVPTGNWVAWATFLNAVHNRMHHSVTDEYLVGTLDKAPKYDPRNTPTLEAAFELDFDANGAIEITVFHTSGVVAFDREVADAVTRSGPFPIPPPALLSPDGRAYALWTMRRDTVFACSTINARPVLFAVAPAP